MRTPLGRLTQRPEFLAVAATRRKGVASGLILQARTTAADAPARVGFTASKKVGNAVLRNRARRRLRAAVRQVMAEHAMPGHDYVVIARGETPDRPFALLLQDLEAALKRVGAWRDGPAAPGEGG